MGSPSLVATRTLGQFKRFHFPHSQSKAPSQGHDTRTNQSNRRISAKSLFPFPAGQPCPTTSQPAGSRPHCRPKANCHTCPGPQPDDATFPRAPGQDEPSHQAFRKEGSRRAALRAKADKGGFRSRVWKIPEASDGSPSGAPGWSAEPGSLKGKAAGQEPLGLCLPRGWLHTPWATWVGTTHRPFASAVLEGRVV